MNFGCRKVIITQTYFTKRIATSIRNSIEIFHVTLSYKDAIVTIDWCQKNNFVDLCIQIDYLHLKIIHYHSFVNFRFFFFYLSFLSWTIMIPRSTGEVPATSLTPLYHFHILHRHLGISRVIPTESWTLHIGSSWAQNSQASDPHLKHLLKLDDILWHPLPLCDRRI